MFIDFRITFEYLPCMLSKRQKQVFDFIREFSKTNGYAPSLQEIASHLRLRAPSTIHHHVGELIEKGLLEKRWNANRSIRIVRGQPDTMLRSEGEPDSPPDNPHRIVQWEKSRMNLVFPLKGNMAAGHAIEAIEEEEWVELPPSLVGRKDTFVLRVQGDSMIDEHIRDGDLVVIEKKNHADNGETVVALLNHSEATLKKFYREKDGRIRLQPANPKYVPIYCELGECQIQGTVIAILRKF